jgi:hypothetical protein
MADIEDAQELQKKDVDGLISCLDDLPLLLGRVKNETLNTSRYQSKFLAFNNFGSHISLSSRSKLLL